MPTNVTKPSWSLSSELNRRSIAAFRQLTKAGCANKGQHTTHRSKSEAEASCVFAWPWDKLFGQVVIHLALCLSHWWGFMDSARHPSASDLLEKKSLSTLCRRTNALKTLRQLLFATVVHQRPIWLTIVLRKAIPLLIAPPHTYISHLTFHTVGGDENAEQQLSAWWGL